MATFALFTRYVFGSGDADWLARSTAAGVTLATRLDTSQYLDYVPGNIPDATHWINGDDTADHVVYDTSVKVNAYTPGSWKFNILNADGAASGQAGIPIGATFDDGDTMWWSFAIRVPETCAYQQWLQNDETGQKLAIMSHSSGSNQGNEIVVQINYNHFLISAYHNPGFASFDEDVGGGEFHWQNQVDNGTNPLTGNDPETGAAWPSAKQLAAQFGGLYSAKSLERSRVGLGDPISGGYKLVPGVWHQVTCRLKNGTMDGTTQDHRFSMWACQHGNPYTLLIDQANNFALDSDGGTTPYNKFYPLPYTTNRAPGGRKVTAVGSEIGGITVLACGLGTPIGAGTLEYVQSTGAFRFKGLGDSYGTAHEFSTANDINIINLRSAGDNIATTLNGGITLPQSSIVLTSAAGLPTSGTVIIGDGAAGGEQRVNYTGISTNTLTGCTGGSGSYSSGADVGTANFIVLRIDNEASLPSSGTTEASVTIADGRPDTQVNYGDVIVSSQPINAPGGYAPAGVSILADAAAGMSSGSWLHLTGGNLPSGLDLFSHLSGLSGLPGYCDVIARDPATGDMYYIGGDHSDSVQGTFFLKYTESTNTWTEQGQVPWGFTVDSQTKHGYHHLCWDSIHRKLWTRSYTDLAIRRWDGGTTWSHTVDYSSLNNYGALGGLAFFPEMGSEGSILIFVHSGSGTNGELIRVNMADEAISTISQTLANSGDGHSVILYSPQLACCVFGGGNGGTSWWRVNSAGTVTQLDDQPSALTEGIGSANGNAEIFVNPANGNLVAYRATVDNVWYDLNVTTGAWTTRSGALDMLTANTSVVTQAICTIEEYGVTVFINPYASSSDAKMWLWKP